MKKVWEALLSLSIGAWTLGNECGAAGVAHWMMMWGFRLMDRIEVNTERAIMEMD